MEELVFARGRELSSREQSPLTRHYIFGVIQSLLAFTLQEDTSTRSHEKLVLLLFNTLQKCQTEKSLSCWEG